MAASTASMCLRSESLSVHSQSRFHASSRFKVCLPPVGSSQASGYSKPILATCVRDVYDAAARVRLLRGAGGVAGDQDARRRLRSVVRRSEEGALFAVFGLSCSGTTFARGLA